MSLDQIVQPEEEKYIDMRCAHSYHISQYKDQYTIILINSLKSDDEYICIKQSD